MELPMMKSPDIGTPESQHLEFKQADSIRTPKGRMKIAREIVAMLNAPGISKLFVGIQDDSGKASGYDLLGDEDEIHISALTDLLIDRIEPRMPFDLLFDFEKIEKDQGFLLGIQVRSPSPSPTPGFCVRDGEKRIYLIRHLDRKRPMEYSELLGNCEPRGPQKFPGKTFLDLWKEMGEQPEHKGWFPREHAFLLAIGLEAPGRERYPVNSSQLKQLVAFPDERDQRPGGWTFTLNQHFRDLSGKPRKVFESGFPEERYRQLRVDHRGIIAFSMDLSHLQWEVPKELSAVFPTAEGMIYPYAFIEYIVSAFRIARAVWKDEMEDGTEVFFKLALTDIQNWVLPRFGPNKVGYYPVERWAQFEEGKDLQLGTHRSKGSSLINNPDELAWIILEDVYSEFGLESNVIPLFSPGPPRSFLPPGR
jgi:schlafen family protein